jgi:hypothetical protein
MAPSSESGAEVETDRAPEQAGHDTAFAPGSFVPGGTGLASIMGNRATARAMRGLRDTLPPGARAVAPANVMLARAAVSRTGRRALQRDVGSDDYKAGYDDGLGGQGARPAPRDGDALIDYEEGFAKGEYDAKHASASPAPAPDSTPAPGVTPAPVDTPAPGPVAGSGKAIKDMTGTEKLAAAYDKAHIKDEVRKQIADLVKPEALFVALLSFAAVYLVSQATPVGWAADLGVLVTAVFIGSVLFDAIKHLIAFADAVNATSDDDLQAAGDAFAAAIVEIGIQTIILLATHKSASGPEGGAPLEGPTPTKFADMVTDKGIVVRVPVDSLPAAATKPLATPKDAVRAAAAVNALMKAGGSGGGGGGGSGGGGSRKGDKSAQSENDKRLLEKYQDRATVSYPPSEWARIEQLEDRFPKLKQAKLRPYGRPRIGDEWAFEERMQTTQGRYSLAAYSSDGKPVVQFDNITSDGWIQEIKIEQSKVQEIVAQLRTLGGFAEDYGLRGVKYSVEPPSVADEVEQQVAEEGMRSVFRDH